MTDTRDDETLAAIADVLGRPTTTAPPPPPPPSGVGTGFAEAPAPPTGPPATGPTGNPLPPVGPTSIVLRPKGTATPVAVTRGHLYVAIAAGVVAAALVAGLVAAVVANRSDSTSSPAVTSTTTRPPTTTSTSTTRPTTTTTAASPVVLDPATLTLPVPRTPTPAGAYGTITRPGELLLIPDPIPLAIEAGTARWEWQGCATNCTTFPDGTGDQFTVPAGTPPGTLIRALLTGNPTGQKGRIQVATAQVLVVA